MCRYSSCLENLNPVPHRPHRLDQSDQLRPLGLPNLVNQSRPSVLCFHSNQQHLVHQLDLLDQQHPVHRLDLSDPLHPVHLLHQPDLSDLLLPVYQLHQSDQQYLALQLRH
jgi:hypothetical protein